MRLAGDRVDAHAAAHLRPSVRARVRGLPTHGQWELAGTRARLAAAVARMVGELGPECRRARWGQIARSRPDARRRRADARARARRSIRCVVLALSETARDLLHQPAIASRPCTHGPHWPALSSASQRATRAVSATGQASRRAAAPRRRRARRRGGEMFVRQRDAAQEPAADPACLRNRRRAALEDSRACRRPRRSATSVRRRARSRRPPGRRPARERYERRARAGKVCRAGETTRAVTGDQRDVGEVSAFATSVGRLRTPCSKTIGGVNVGIAGPPLR